MFDPLDRDPVAILEQQHLDRVPELVPVRVGRMVQSPFAFFRGAAAVMADDLAGTAVTGTHVVACGDAHLANFGLYASPERRQLFDLNDFDEAYPGPWEWDVRRLAASFWIHGRGNSYTEAQCESAAKSAVTAYQRTLTRLFEMTATQRYYFQVEPGAVDALDQAHALTLATTAKKARTRTSDQVLRKLTTFTEEGLPRISDQFPIVRHTESNDIEGMRKLFARYQATVRGDIELLLSQYTLVDFVMRIVGVGSVGTRCWLALLLGPSGEPLFLQAKEAPPSVIKSHGRVVGAGGALADAVIERGGEGVRVVTAQRVLQAQSDPFLGWVGGVRDRNDIPRDYYIRQFRDMKGSLDLDELTAGQAVEYAALCGTMLARGHAQSPGSAFISGYLGNNHSFATAIARWSERYADQNERDHQLLDAAVRAGRLPAELGV